MDNNELITSLVALGGVPLILGLVQLFKPFISDTRYYALLALAFGLIINFIVGVVLGAGWIASLFNGITAGLAAAGLYSTGSTFKEGALADKNNRSEENRP